MTDNQESGRSFWVASEPTAGAGQNGGPRHARKSSSKYAAHIGRVGALAVFLGVGFAAANGPGIAVAFASPDADSGAGASSGASTGGGGSSDPSGDSAATGTSADDGDGSGASDGAWFRVDI